MNRTAPPPLRTYSHLAHRRKVPSEYDIVSSRLLYHVERGFEIDVPLAPFYQRYQRDGGPALPGLGALRRSPRDDLHLLHRRCSPIASGTWTRS